MSDMKGKLAEVLGQEAGKYIGVGAVVAGMAYLGMSLVDPGRNIDEVKQKAKVEKVSQANNKKGLNKRKSLFKRDSKFINDGLKLDLAKGEEEVNDDGGNTIARTAPQISKAPLIAKKKSKRAQNANSNSNSSNNQNLQRASASASEYNFNDLEEAAPSDESSSSDDTGSSDDTIAVGGSGSSDDSGDDEISTSEESSSSSGGSSASTPPGITLSSISGNTKEDLTTATFTVRLNTMPTANVVLTFSTTDGDEVDVTSPGGGVVTFTNADYNIDQTVTLTGVDDDEVDGTQSFTIDMLSASADTNYNALATTLSSSNEDDDTRTVASSMSPADSAIGIAATSTTITVTFSNNIDCTSKSSNNFRVVIDGSDLTGTLDCPAANQVRFTIANPSGTDFTNFYSKTAQVIINNYTGFVADYPNTSAPAALVDAANANNYIAATTLSFTLEHQVSSIATGTAHTCVRTVDTSGSLKCWGRNDYGQLGANSTNHLGDQINEMGSGLTTLDSTHFGHAISKSYAGKYHTCILDTNTDLHCWGRNDQGQLGLGHNNDIGDGEALNAGNTLVVTGVLDAALGDNHTCVLLAANTVKCWGDNAYGQLGVGSTTDSNSVPGSAIDINGLDALAITAGANHTCVIRDQATDDVVCWGLNNSGQLGIGSTTSIGDEAGEMGASLTTVDLATHSLTPTKLAAGDEHTCITSADNKLFCWGANANGQLGYGSTDNKGDAAAELAGLTANSLSTAPSSLVLGGDQTCLIFSDNTAQCFGDNAFGQLGIGDTSARGDAPGELSSLSTINFGSGAASTVLSLDTRGDHVCAIVNTGEIKCYGKNDYGQLGLQDFRARGAASDEIGDALAHSEILGIKPDGFFFNMPAYHYGSNDSDLDIYFEYDGTKSYDQYRIVEGRSCSGTWTALPAAGSANTQTDLLSVTGAGEKFIAAQFRNSADTSIQSKCFVRDFALVSATPTCTISAGSYTNTLANEYTITDATSPAGLEMKVSVDNDCSSDGTATWEITKDSKEKTFTAGDGNKDISVQCRNNVGTSACDTATIYYDTTGPVVAKDTDPVATDTSTFVTWDTTDAGVNNATDVGLTYECHFSTVPGGSALGTSGFTSCSTVCGTYSGNDDATDVRCDFTHDADGAYILQVRGTDALGNTGSAVSYSWTADSFGPNCSIDTIEGGAVGAFSNPNNADPVAFAFTCTDLGSGIDNGTAECSAVQAPGADSWGACDSFAAGSGTHSVNIPATTNASYTFKIRVQDNAGNTADTIGSHTWVADNDPPAAPTGIALNSPASSPNNTDDTPDIDVSGLENTTNAEVRVYADAGCTTTPVSGWTAQSGATTTVTLNALTDSLDYTLYAKQRDEATNESSCSGVSVAYRYDNTAPSAPTNVTLNDPATSPGTDTTPELTVTGLDNSLVDNEVALFSDSGCSTAISAWTTINAASMDITTNVLPENVYTIYAAQRDNVPNQSSCSAVKADYIYDITPPTDPASVVLNSPASSPGADQTPNIDVTGLENSVGSTVQLYDDAGCTNAISGWTAQSGTTTTVTTNSLTDGSTYNVYAKQRDAALNLSPGCVGGTVYHVDVTAPAAPTIARNGHSSPTDATQTPSFTVGNLENSSGSEVALLEGSCPGGTVVSAWTSQTGATQNLSTSSLTEGTTYTIYSAQRDEAGNTTCSAGTLTFLYDNTDPVVSITGTTRVDATDRTINFTSSDAGASGYACTCGTTTNPAGACSGGTTSGNVTLAPPIASQDYYVKCTDNAGNSTEVSSSERVLINNRSESECTGQGGAAHSSDTCKIAGSSCGAWTLHNNLQQFTSATCNGYAACAPGSNCTTGGTTGDLVSSAQPTCSYQAGDEGWDWTSYGYALNPGVPPTIPGSATGSCPPASQYVASCSVPGWVATPGACARISCVEHCTNSDTCSATIVAVGCK